ncbi:MAG: glycosyltransferase [Candidatus Nezhaarchaeales archaeon]
MDFLLVCDAMMDLEGGNRPAACLAYELARRGFDVSVASPVMSRDVEGWLNRAGITPINLKAKLLCKGLGYSLLWFELWTREAFFRLTSRRLGKAFATVNFSHVLATEALFWYAQGATSMALEDGWMDMPKAYRLGYMASKPVIGWADRLLVKEVCNRSRFVIANSRFCASMYEKYGVKIHKVIYPPIDLNIFKPTTSRPTEDYVLTYLGKESKTSVIKKVADRGVKIKAFGSKPPFLKDELKKHPNIELLGRVPTRRLVELYSNALYTLFTFTHEPFGYIPLESMACGTPVLTYNKQGPSETVIHGRTGWLVQDDDEMVETAEKLWKNGYNHQARTQCVKEAEKLDTSHYIQAWSDVLQKALNAEQAR